jgi:transcriptional regulator with XRE-family HTH domain
MRKLDVPTWLTKHFAAQLVRLRKQRGWTQQRLADALGLNLTQIKRYETGASQPSLEALKKIALTLSVSLDDLVFGDAERGPDEALKLKFEAIRQFDTDERRIAEGVLDSLIVQHQAKRLFVGTATAASTSHRDDTTKRAAHR